MGEYLTKSFFKQKLKELGRHAEYFEVAPAPNCCPKCAEKANKKIAIATATRKDYPPFHRECICSILPLWDGQEAGHFARQKANWEAGIYPYKICPHCSRWIEGNATVCVHCEGIITEAGCANG